MNFQLCRFDAFSLVGAHVHLEAEQAGSVGPAATRHFPPGEGSSRIGGTHMLSGQTENRLGSLQIGLLLIKIT